MEFKQLFLFDSVNLWLYPFSLLIIVKLGRLFLSSNISLGFEITILRLFMFRLVKESGHFCILLVKSSEFF
jgi:hypothetical protein